MSVRGNAISNDAGTTMSEQGRGRGDGCALSERLPRRLESGRLPRRPGSDMPQGNWHWTTYVTMHRNQIRPTMSQGHLLFYTAMHKTLLLSSKRSRLRKHMGTQQKSLLSRFALAMSAVRSAAALPWSPPY